jgi:hypothetical protein
MICLSEKLGSENSLVNANHYGKGCRPKKIMNKSIFDEK